MNTYKFEAHYRYTSFGEVEKDFYQGEIDAIDWESAEKEIKEKDRRIFKIERLWK